jgi:hypothetical protein
MSETKRGWPTEDGNYDILLKDGHVVVRKILYGKEFDLPRAKEYDASGPGLYPAKPNCVAHRRREPMEIPPLKKIKHLSSDRLKIVVIEANENYAYPGVYLAVRMGDYYHIADSLNVRYSNARELTKSQCEALGYEWPL